MIKNSTFYRTMLKITIPIALQNIVMSALNALDTFMISSLGEVAISGVGFANKIFFFYAVICFGINTGAATFMSQYYGKNDEKGIKKVMGLCMTLSIMLGLVFASVGFFIPEKIIGLFSVDETVISIGASYFRAVSPSYLLFSILSPYAIGFRTTGSPRTPMYGSVTAFIVNAIGNYILIFGKFGFPALGAIGAAIATVIARFAELMILVFAAKKYGGPMNFKIPELFTFDRAFAIHYLKITAPVIIEETFWSFAQVLYTKAYSLLGTDSVASIQITTTIADIFLVFSRGLANAGTVMIGNQIGANEAEEAYTTAIRFLKVVTVVGIATGGVMIGLSDILVKLFSNLKPEVQHVSSIILKFTGVMVFIRNINSTIIVGILRAGGDTKYSMFLELSSAWVLGVPMAFLGAAVLKLPIQYVYMLVALEEVGRFAIGMPRVFSKKWIRDVTVEKGR